MMLFSRWTAFCDDAIPHGAPPIFWPLRWDLSLFTSAAGRPFWAAR